MIVMLCLVVSVGRFSLDSYLPSLPSIASAFHATTGQVQLTLTYYFFGYGISQFFYGPLSEKFGRRNILLIGMFVFLLGSYFCVVSTTINILIYSRLLAGTGAGAAGVLARAIISDWFPQDKVAGAWAQVTTAIVISLIIGPVLGGIIEQNMGFRYNFWLSFVYGFVVLIVIMYALPETHHERASKTLNIKKIVFLYFCILKDIKFLCYVSCSTLAFSALTIFFQLSPFIFIGDFDYSPIKYSFILMWVAFTYMLGGQFVRIYSKTIKPNEMIAFGAVLILSASILLAMSNLLFKRFETTAVIGISLLFVVGSRIIVPTGLGAGLKLYKHIAGYAAALSGGGQMLGNTLISYCVAEIFLGPSLHRLTCILFVISVFILMIMFNLRRINLNKLDV
ncbi:MAG: Bcr/CflA family efflux MFS transporter [Gammaproteobacteria bacterium]|nr:Bcr/CflA family efflux MFS transporter [Gammaproteobacteria bacterium]